MSPSELLAHRQREDDERGLKRFTTLIYLYDSHGTGFEAPLQLCQRYALKFGWAVSGVITDSGEDSPPDSRAGLRRALEIIQSGGAESLLAPWRSAISPISGEFDQVAGQLEKAGGFLQIAAGVLAVPADHESQQ
jgi:hypothetical protein